MRLKIQTLREARFFLEELQHINCEFIQFKFPDIKNKTDIQRVIYEFFDRIRLTNKNHEKIKKTDIDKLNQIYNERFLPDDYFTYITYNERISYYSFIYLSETRITNGELNKTSIEKIHPEINNQPTSHRNTNEFIYAFFDSSYKSNQEKINITNKIRHSFLSNHIGLETSLDWLDKKNTNQCNWAYDYLLKQINQEKNKEIEKLNLPNLSWLTIPYTHAEKLNFVIGTLDYWEKPIEEKKKFFIKMRKAWDQQKLRNNTKKEKKPNLCIHIDIEIKKNLEEISKISNEKINLIIEDLIKSKHSEMLIKIQQQNKKMEFPDF